MTARKSLLIGTLMCSAAIIVATSSSAQTTSLDRKAWDAVWDRLEMVLPANTDTESVHALTIIVPATWARDDPGGFNELQNIAGAIPDATFSTDPSRMKLMLHRQYANYILDVNLPELSPAQQAALLAAQQAYADAFDKYLQRRNSYLEEWKKYEKQLIASGQPVTTTSRLQFRSSMGPYFSGVQGKMDAAMLQVQKFAPVAGQWVAALQKLRNELLAVQSDPDLLDVWRYDGGIPTLKSIKDDCKDDGPGWDEVILSRSTSSNKVRSSDWNASGNWEAGGFLDFGAGGGGGGSDFEKSLRSSADNITLRFCKLTYVPLRPGAWFDISFLQAIDKGQIKLKPSSPVAGEVILGPDGTIPYLVKGAVVARRIMFKAKLDQMSLDEMRRSSSGSGGIRVGPLRIGGGGGSSEYKREYAGESGIYGRSTDTDVPVIIAIVTEPTKPVPKTVASARHQ